jgi:hypothetical protein
MARKRRPFKSPVRTRIDDVSSPNTIRRGEIVEEIVDHLRPWKDRKGIAARTADVNHKLNLLREIVPLEATVFDRTQNRTHARQLDTALTQVETLLASAPEVLAWFLFNPLPPATMSEDGVLLQALPPPIEDIKSAWRNRSEAFTTELKRMHKVCARAIHPGFGTHPNYNHAKHTSAWFAHGLMRQSSDRKITGTKDAAFQAIACLFYEAISGEQDADLKRACDSVLRLTGGAWD